MRIHLRIHVPSGESIPQGERVVHPYARREDDNLMKSIMAVHTLHENITTPPPCDYTHDVPAAIFSSGGFFGNQFHELNENIIPLFITTRLFRSRLRFLIVDHKPSFVRKYDQILSHLSNYEVINPTTNGSVHCFPGAVVGLHFHAHLAINSSDLPSGYSMPDFKQFLREAYNLKVWTVSEIKKPVLVLVSRSSSRTFLNEEEMVGLMEELGFRVVVTRPRKMSDLKKHSQLINSCSVMVGMHGAGLTHELFLPSGAVVVQVVPLGLEWASEAYFGEPAQGMGVEYMEYRVEPEESSLFKLYGRDHPVINDPESVFKKSWQVGRAVYVDGQHVRIDLVRFRKTLVQALKLVGPAFI